MSDLVTLIQQRTSNPKLKAPAPDRATVETLLNCAVRAPDHGKMRPWRFLVLENKALEELGAAFEQAGLATDPEADDAKRNRWRAMPLRAPMMIVAVASLRPNPKVPDWEQVAAVSAAVQNIQLAAHALGYAAMWRTGDMTNAPAVFDYLNLAPSDRIVAFLYIGTSEGATRPADFQPLDQCVEYRQ